MVLVILPSLILPSKFWPLRVYIIWGENVILSNWIYNFDFSLNYIYYFNTASSHDDLHDVEQQVRFESNLLPYTMKS